MTLLRKHRLGFYYYINSSVSETESLELSCNTTDISKTSPGNAKPKRIIFLDRDGVINIDSEEFIKNWSEFIFCEGSLEAIRLLTISNFVPVVISNQSGINRGILTLEHLAEITVNMINEIEKAGGIIGAVCYCPHEPEENCLCRKPRTKMSEFAVNSINAGVENTYFLGDREGDVKAALNFGVTPILIDDSLDTHEIKSLDTKIPGFICNSLLTAVKKIILTS